PSNGAKEAAPSRGRRAALLDWSRQQSTDYCALAGAAAAADLEHLPSAHFLDASTDIFFGSEELMSLSLSLSMHLHPPTTIARPSAATLIHLFIANSFPKEGNPRAQTIAATARQPT